MTEDYCKLVSGIILSTVWREEDYTRILWITMLAVKGRDHRVLASVPGLAAVANLTVESVRAGLARLMAPDPDSRTKEHEGRRIMEIEGGWWVINGEKYRNYLSKQERNEYQKKLMAERRGRAKRLAPVSKCEQKLALLAQAEAEAEADTKAVKKSGYSVPACFESVDGFSAALAGWIEARKLKKNPPTGRAIQLVINRLAERPKDAVAALDMATVKGWSGIQWDWFDNSKPRAFSGTVAPKASSMPSIEDVINGAR